MLHLPWLNNSKSQHDINRRIPAVLARVVLSDFWRSAQNVASSPGPEKVAGKAFLTTRFGCTLFAQNKSRIGHRSPWSESRVFRACQEQK
jgi:hypothetical protein